MKKVLLVLFISVILSACSETEIIDFEGESDNWRVIYTVEILDEQIEQTKVKIEYSGEESIPDEVSYIIEFDSGKMEGNTSLNDKGLVKIGGRGRLCSECIFMNESENIKATISWKENTEKLKLKRYYCQLESNRPWLSLNMITINRTCLTL
ncbi:hypothetical protein [Oceanobacillus kapialis]|uniref:Lipoprotein n=1 Tax=Oceanobacillus kapialis TaxID=481353 RepID=A0ABW5PXE3_9BACI